MHSLQNSLGLASWELTIPLPMAPQGLDKLKIHISDACKSADMQILPSVRNEIIILIHMQS
jgi:hypothetical protein